MAPREAHAESYARAARAARMRGTGASWEQIARNEGYRSRQAAQLAVRRHREREVPGSMDNQRRDADEGYKIVQQTLFAELADCRRSGDSSGVVTTARAITDVIGKRVQLNGLAVPVRTEVEVQVSGDPAAILADTRRRLLEVVDAESIEMKELG